jgi:four helix bundle protein
MVARSLTRAVLRMHERLVAWQVAVDLAAEVYRLSTVFPASERYGLTQQLRRAAISISSNIAEGFGRQTTREFRQFLAVSRGSLREVESLLAVSERLEFSTTSALAPARGLAIRTGKLINGLRKRFQVPSTKSQAPSTH